MTLARTVSRHQNSRQEAAGRTWNLSRRRHGGDTRLLKRGTVRTCMAAAAQCFSISP